MANAQSRENIALPDYPRLLCIIRRSILWDAVRMFIPWSDSLYLTDSVIFERRNRKEENSKSGTQKD